MRYFKRHVKSIALVRRSLHTTSLASLMILNEGIEVIPFACATFGALSTSTLQNIKFDSEYSLFEKKKLKINVQKGRTMYQHRPENMRR